MLQDSEGIVVSEFNSDDVVELVAAAKAVTGMIEIFADDLRIREFDGCNRQSVVAFERLETLRAAIARFSN